MDKKSKEQISTIAEKFRTKKGYDFWQVQLWLNAKNPNMGNMTPIEAALSGKYEQVIRFIEDERWES
jgi:hypothetical protein